MARPIANAGTSPAAAPFTDLPIASQALSFSGTPGTGGTSITHYRSWILDKPTGSSASLSNNAIAAPNLLNIDTPGTVVVFVQVADNRFDPGLTPDPWEHATNEPYVSVADPRSAPDSAFVVVSVKTEHLDAEIPGAWERNWRAKYEDFVGKVDTEVGDLAPLTAGPTSDATALHTHEEIPMLAVDELTIGDFIKLVNSAFPSTPAVLTGDYDSNTCAHLNGVADKDIILQRLATLGSGFAKIHMKNGAVEISGGLAAESDLTTDWIQSRSTNGQVTVRGRGTHTGDLRTDIIESDTNNAGVEVKGRGTHTYDLKAAIIQADTIDEATAAGGVTIDGVLLKDNRARSQVGSSSAPRPPVANMGSEYLGLATTGTTLASLANMVIPANALAQAGQWAGRAIYSCAATTDSKRIAITAEATSIFDQSAAINGVTFMVNVWIFRTGTNTQVAFVQVIGAGFALTITKTALALDETVVNRIYFGAQSTVTGDVVLETVSAQHQDNNVT